MHPRGFSVRPRTQLLSLFVAAAAFGLAAPADAQFAERGELVNSGEQGVDASGRSVKAPRIRMVHSDSAADLGTSAHLIAEDPFLAYQLGRNLNFREFRTRDGAFAEGTGSGTAGFAGPMVDGTTAKITANNQTSCLGCHNLPNGNPGGGPNFAKDSGLGRNSPHYYGGGLMEMFAIQIRADLMSQLDTDLDGWVSAAEAEASAAELFVTPSEDGDPISYGSGQLDGGSIGSPQLNSIFRVWYGGPTGGGDGETIEIKPGTTSIDGVTTTHYNFEMVVFGWGQRAPPSALNPTTRAFFWDPMVTHTGMAARDPSTLDDPDGDGVSLPTLAGSIQFPATHKAPDAGTVLTGNPGFEFSADDPDGDGYLEEVTEGDLDMAEWFMLNAPRPAFAGTEQEFKKGLKQLDKAGCTECHVAEWTINAADATYAGDRRFFDLEVTWRKFTKQEKKATGELGTLEGKLVPLYTEELDSFTRNFGAFTETALFTDFRQHEMGPELAELAYDGNLNTRWRTAPLWGVGSGFPWNHDGAALTIEDAILRHGGDAQESRDKFAKFSAGKRKKFIDFLEKLVLYDIESLPADIDGDGVISTDFMVGGMNTGTERFNAEWLFNTPVVIQGDVTNTDGDTIRSFAATNLADAYRLNDAHRVDTDEDGWPDVMDENPAVTGYKDGINN